MKILTFTLLIIVSIDIIAQENREQVIIPFLKNGKYGFANEENKVVIKAKYDWVLPFYKGYELTTVLKKGKPLLINKTGKAVFKGSSDYFRNDTISEMRIIPHQKIERIALKTFYQTNNCPEFAIIEAFDEKKVFDKINELYFVSNGEKVILINEKGEIHSQEYDRIRHYNYGEIEYCITEDQYNQKYGLLDENGKTLLECVYDAINYKGHGVFSIKQGTIERDFKVNTKEYTLSDINNGNDGIYMIKRKDGKLGVLDSTGKEFLSFTYDKLYPLNKNRYVFWKENQVGILDINEKVLFSHELPFSYSVRNQNRGFVAYSVFNKNNVFFNVNNQWVLINLNGQELGKHDGFSYDFQEIVDGIAGINNDNKLGVIDKTGATILQPLFEQIYCLRADKSFVVKKDGKWHWLNNKGNAIFSDFDDFTYLLKKHLLILKNNTWYYVNNKGKEFKFE